MNKNQLSAAESLAEAAEVQFTKEQYCELYFFIAEYYRSNKEKDKANEFYQKCIDTGITTFLEYECARYQLKTLFK